MIPDPVGDVRADNFLITTSEVIFVDWPSACIGAPLFDAIALLPSMALQGGPDRGSLLPRLRASALADPDAVTAVLAAIAGYFVHQSMQPAPKRDTGRPRVPGRAGPGGDGLATPQNRLGVGPAGPGVMTRECT